MSLIRLIAVAAIMATGGILARGEDSQKTRELFEKPPAQFSTAPFWVWNEMMTDELVISTLHDLAGQGIKQVFIHPRPGLMTPYLSDEWFRLWRLALDEAKRLGIKVWIYDENSYPSGFAGGFVPQLMPESRGMGLSIKEVNGPPKWSADTIGIYQKQGDEYVNITEKVKNGETNESAIYLTATVNQSNKSAWYGNRTYVNLLTKGVTEKFLEVTLDAYKREFGGEFGKDIPGAFTDEPHILPAGQLPWAMDLPEVFEKRWGYSLIDNLPCLSRPVGDWKKVRHNYYATVLELFIDRWARPYYEYCEKNNLEFTGHYWEHEWPNGIRGPDNMAMSAWMHRPGIDILFNQYAENVHSQFGNVRSVMEIASIANQLDKKRTLCEAYGGAGWDLRFEDMKRIGDWLSVLGINTINEHLSFVSIRGARKADYPQSFSYHEPWWDAYHVPAGYFARLSAALSQGQQINEVLVLEPTTTAWMYQLDPNHKTTLEKIGTDFQRLVVSLVKEQVEFDIGCEDVIARNGSVNGAVLKVGRRDYKVVVLPALMENLNGKTLELLEQYAANGGQILSCGQADLLVDGNTSEKAIKLKQSAGFKQVSAGDLAKDLLSRTEDSFAITVEDTNDGILLHHRRRIDDGQILFLTNTSINANCQGAIQCLGKGIEKWDPETGEIEPYFFKKMNMNTDVATYFLLEPCGSLLLFISDKEIEPAKARAGRPRHRGAKESKETEPKPAGEMKIKRLNHNVLTLDFVDVNTAKKKFEKAFYNKAASAVFREHGFSENPWEHAVQFRDEIINRKFDPDSGFEATYGFTIKDKTPKPLYVVIERPESYTISCNGKTVEAKSGEWWLDKSFGKIDISSAAKKGENKITIKAKPFSIYDEIAAVFILGDFRLESAESGFIIVPDKPIETGPWNKQGYPFYADKVSYTQRFNVKDLKGGYIVELNKWSGSVAIVLVNGKEAGLIWHQPWRCDVTKQIKKGNNDIEVIVIGTLKNTLGPHHVKAAPGQVSPSTFQSAPSSGPPAGEKYNTSSYGLFEPFELVKQ